jgi:hypothetical protein
VVLEYRTNPFDPDDIRCGRTNKTILNELKHYRNLAVFGKDADDGSSYMRNYVDMRMHSVEELIIVGVNLDCCVWSTAEGLAANHHRIQVTILEECCFSTSSRAENKGYAYVVKHVEKELKHEMTASNLRMSLDHEANASNLKLQLWKCGAEV